MEGANPGRARPPGLAPWPRFGPGMPGREGRKESRGGVVVPGGGYPLLLRQGRLGRGDPGKPTPPDCSGGWGGCEGTVLKSGEKMLPRKRGSSVGCVAVRRVRGLLHPWGGVCFDAHLPPPPRGLQDEGRPEFARVGAPLLSPAGVCWRKSRGTACQ